ncbi:DNA binding protein [Octadecabacter Antarctic DB virus 2]|nr:DNA binding protein [Octadecabacter Antarctic DB virus 2]
MKMINTAEQKVLDQIARFRTKTGMAKTMFGKNAVGDANLIGQLESGRQLRHDMREKIKAFIKSGGVKK